MGFLHQVSGFVGLLLFGLLAAVPVRGEDGIAGNPPVGESGFLPEPVTEASFEVLKTNSPFRRSVELSDSIVLTGMARIEDDVFATLLNTETTESHLVSKLVNPNGWQLVGFRGEEDDLETLTAKIQIAGGEVVSIRYEKNAIKSAKRKSGSSRSSGSARLTSAQLIEARNAAIKYREGYSSDGYPREPPPEVVQKLSRMTVQQREAINRKMIELRNRGLGMEERRRIYNESLDRALQGRR